MPFSIPGFQIFRCISRRQVHSVFSRPYSSMVLACHFSPYRAESTHVPSSPHPPSRFPPRPFRCLSVRTTASDPAALTGGYFCRRPVILRTSSPLLTPSARAFFHSCLLISPVLTVFGFPPCILGRSFFSETLTVFFCFRHVT